MWVIDKLALRVGGDKNEDEEADTVGCCTLRLEHVHFITSQQEQHLQQHSDSDSDSGGDDDDDNGSGSRSKSSTTAAAAVDDDETDADSDSLLIELEFLGKDSMLYKQTTDFTKYGYVGRRVYNNLQFFCRNSRRRRSRSSNNSNNNNSHSNSSNSASDRLFDLLTPPLLNAHLQELMPGLTAKVFRTYNASDTLQRLLLENAVAEKMQTEELDETQKVMRFNDANREVAILCNHQRTVTQAMQAGIDNLLEKLNLLRKQLTELVAAERAIGKKKSNVDILQRADREVLANDVAKAVENAKQLKTTAKTGEEKVAATKADEEAKQLKKELTRTKSEQAHRFARMPLQQQLKRRIEIWITKIAKLELDIRSRDDNKEVSLTTSKINYCDPRISVAWCKRCEVPIERVFSKSLREKFNWAMAVPPDWRFAPAAAVAASSANS